MKLPTLIVAPAVELVDGNGQVVDVHAGKRTLLAFFRDTTCPFCNFRIFELTQRHAELSAAGLEIIAVFASTPNEVARFTRLRPRPFRVVADPADLAYRAYGIQRSFAGKLHAVFFRTREWLTGMRAAGWLQALRSLGGLGTNNLLPADFLIDESGYIRDVHYGEDAGDHIPFERIERFLAHPAPTRQ
ncbi:redoxin domain-containing protein [Stenotrophomonas sp. NLF4-10]|uniref:redoxin domain-containing protein n=1 Tax=Stenotrophomonas sp. NLF4-10 TaxID=2918754 RepID=UPI001EFBC252|nr:redoxin domain-containing protein [Stenotrophomonas sp. NLF4-10]MCG8274922.1 redoxin domain-containing protein [Stenotrophomonas sp. NLF4-10]